MMTGTGGNPLVLVVDDFLDAREMYAQYFEFSGFRVAEACDPSHDVAPDHLANHRYQQQRRHK